MDGALKDYRAGEQRRRSWGDMLAWVVAVLVLALPLGLGLAGFGLAWALWPSLSGLIYGAVVIVAAIWLLPRRPKLPKGLLRREDLPGTFALLDRICSRLKAPRVDAVDVSGEINASIGQIRGIRVLTLGAPLWVALAPDERLALIGHEIGHLVNQDPRRGRLVGLAAQILDRWGFLFSPGSNDTVVTWLIFAPPAFVVELWQQALGRLGFMASQRAEYRADALAGELAGMAAAARLLEKVSLAELGHREMIHGRAEGDASGTALVQRVAAAIATPDATLRAVALKQMADENWTVDNSHPPTRLRIAFLARIGGGEVDLSDWQAHLAAVEGELAPMIERCGLKLQDRLILQ